MRDWVLNKGVEIKAKKGKRIEFRYSRFHDWVIPPCLLWPVFLLSLYPNFSSSTLPRFVHFPYPSAQPLRGFHQLFLTLYYSGEESFRLRRGDNQGLCKNLQKYALQLEQKMLRIFENSKETVIACALLWIDPKKVFHLPGGFHNWHVPICHLWKPGLGPGL